MDEFLQYAEQIDPLWAVAVAAAVLGVFLAIKLGQSSFAFVLAGALTFVVVGGIAAAGYYGYAYFEDQKRLEERRLLEERAEVLFTKMIEPDSVFACIDGSPAPAMLEACERSLFAEPQRVAAAVAIVTQRIAFLQDALAFASARDPSYAARIAAMRNAVETDPFGLVAFVLSVEHGCTHEACGRFAMLRDPARVRENMRVRRLEAYLAKHSANWKGSSEASAEPTPAAAPRSSAPVVTIIEPEAPAERPSEQRATGDAEPVAAATNDPPVPPAILPLVRPPSAATIAVEPPAAAVAPVVTSAQEKDFKEPPQPVEAADAEPSEAKGRKETAKPAADTKGQAAAKGAPAAKGTAEAAKSAARSAASVQAKTKTKTRAPDPVSRPSTEPVAGLPRVVPSEYLKDREEQEETPGQTAAPAVGAPTPITPQQNFGGN